MARNVEENIIFAVSPEGTGDGVPLVILGVPRGAWRYMHDGKTHNFDLTKVGIPVKLMIFGAMNHDAAMKILDDAAKAGGTTYEDARQKDFSIQPKG
jgi:hypothetical protein